MNVGSTAIGWVLAAVGMGLLVVPLVVGDDDDAEAGFSGHIQSGTCAQPTDDFKVDLESEDSSHDVEPYVAIGDDGAIFPLATLVTAAVVGAAVVTFVRELERGHIIGLITAYRAMAPRFWRAVGAELLMNVLVALISVGILISPAAKKLSIDSRLAQRRPALSPLLTNRRQS